MAEADVATFDLDVVRRFADQAVEGLAAAREEIDALNVYPVPDGDTGTNMFLTVESARDAMVEALAGAARTTSARRCAPTRGVPCSVPAATPASSSASWSARCCGASARPGRTTGRRPVFAEGMALATEAAYAAVGDTGRGHHPVRRPGRLRGGCRRRREDPDDRLGDVVRAAASAAREALARTPEQLPLLAQAGVVDAGGRGLCVVLDAAESAITGKRATTATPHVGSPAIPVANIPSGDLTEGGPAYEVMYLLEADDDAIPSLRQELAPLGDSLVVVGGEGLWNVHVHVDDVGAAVEAGIRAGAPRRIQVTHFAEQMDRAREKRAERRGRKLVIVAAGPGLVELFGEGGAEVIEGGPGRRPSTGSGARRPSRRPGRPR